MQVMTMGTKMKLTTKTILNKADKTTILKMMKMILKIKMAETVMTVTTTIIIKIKILMIKTI